MRSGVDPSEAARRCGPRLLDVHLKDVTAATKEGVPIEAGRGVIDLPRFLRALAELDYRGTAAFEYEKDGRDPLPGLAESLGYVRGILAAWAGPDGRPERDHLEK
jgi:sugar phosphate isomerase/epimerase